MIKQKFEELLQEDASSFSYEVDQDTGIPRVLKVFSKKAVNFGAMKIINYEIVSASDAPFEMFSKYDTLFKKYEETISNEILGVLPSIQAHISSENYPLFSEKLTSLAYGDTTIAVWHDVEEEQTFVLMQSISGEEERFGYLGMICLCRLDE